jgi:magnesium chelatase subunit I
VELPLNARLEDVVGRIDEQATVDHERKRIRRGILARADRNLLYIDEINLLSDDIIDAILDAAAQGAYTVHRDSISATYRARFVLIGSMNPEEGRLRPQIMDRFGLRVIVHGLEDPAQRLEAYHRVIAFQSNQRSLITFYREEMQGAAREIQAARQQLLKVVLPDKVAKPAIRLIQKLEIDSLRAEITWFEAGRAYAAADGRKHVTPQDLQVVAPMALRLRRSKFMAEFFTDQKIEEEELGDLLAGLHKNK